MFIDHVLPKYYTASGALREAISSMNRAVRTYPDHSLRANQYSQVSSKHPIAARRAGVARQEFIVNNLDISSQAGVR
jgi:hypothetical protein